MINSKTANLFMFKAGPLRKHMHDNWKDALFLLLSKPPINKFMVSRACSLVGIQLFQEKLSYKSVKVFAAMLKGIMGNAGQWLLKAFHYDRRKQHKHVYFGSLLTSIKED